MSGKSIGVICPHCNTRLLINGRKNKTPLLSSFGAICPNPNCYAGFAVNIEITKQVQPSLAPVPEIAAQLSHRRDVLAAS